MIDVWISVTEIRLTLRNRGREHARTSREGSMRSFATCAETISHSAIRGALFWLTIASISLFSQSAKADYCEYTYWGCVDCDWTGPAEYYVDDWGNLNFYTPSGTDEICEPYPGSLMQFPISQVTLWSQGNLCHPRGPLPVEEQTCYPEPRQPNEPIADPNQQAVIGIGAIWRGANPFGTCQDLGSNWYPLTWDGNAQILYCKQLSKTVPENAVVAVAGLWAGRRRPPPDCSTLGAGWSAFSYDGKANLNYCMQIGPTAGGYIRDMTAVWKSSCAGLGNEWSGVIWNGNAEMEYCADFN